jgi:hypothetical protein
VREAWVKQVQEKKEECEKAEREQLEAMKEREVMKLAEDERQRQEHEQKKEKALILQLQLKRQVEELRWDLYFLVMAHTWMDQNAVRKMDNVINEHNILMY